MKFGYKIYIFLSCTYWKCINNKIEVKISQMILASIAKGSIESNQNVPYRNLVISKEPKNITFPKSIIIMFYILRIRGLTRTILMLAKPFPHISISEYTTLGRFSLATIVFRNYKIFKTQFLARLSFNLNFFNEYSKLPVFSSTQLLNEYEIARFVNYKHLVFEKPINKKYWFRHHKFSLASKYLFVDSFVNWNSKFFIIFITRNNLEKFVNDFLLQSYPAVSTELKRLQIMQFDNHSLSNLKLDDIYQKKGFDAYEEIRDAEILHQKFIKVGEKFLILEITSSLQQEFVAGLWAYTNRIYRDHDLTTIILPNNNLKCLSEGIYLIGRCDENWYHFLLDTLPRLLFFESISMDVPLLIRSDIPKTTKEFISKITNRRIIELEPNTRIKVSKLYVCPGRSTVYDVKPPKHENWVEFSPILLSKLRDKIMDCLADESSPNILGTILISRESSKRNLLNAVSIKKVVSESAVPIYELDQDFFRNQIKIFANTKHVISPGGAVLANIIFMRPGSRVTVLRSYGYSKLNIWKQLAEIAKVQYSEVRGIPSYWGFNFLRRLHSNFYISPRKLRRMFSEEI